MSERSLRIVFIVLAAFQLAFGAYMVIDPGSFFEELGRYGARNDHYVGDVAAVHLGYGVALGLAAYRPRWQAPLLIFGALWYAAHAVNHLFDIDEARSDARGVVDTVLLAMGALALAWLARIADRTHLARGETVERSG